MTFLRVETRLPNVSVAYMRCISERWKLACGFRGEVEIPIAGRGEENIMVLLRREGCYEVGIPIGNRGEGWWKC